MSGTRRVRYSCLRVTVILFCDCRTRAVGAFTPRETRSVVSHTRCVRMLSLPLSQLLRQSRDCYSATAPAEVAVR